MAEHGPITRKPSIWGKMFDGFKFHDGKEEIHTSTMDVQQDAFEPGEKGGLMIHTPTSAHFSINETQPLEEPKRNFSIALTDVFRRGSEASNRSRAESPQRKASVPSGSRKHSIFHSSNPDTDDIPQRKASVPSGSRKHSIFHSSNPDTDDIPHRKGSTQSNHSSHSGGASRNNSVQGPSSDGGRRPSYVPKNATSSFLSSTVMKTAEERAKIQAGVSAAGAQRKASIVAMSDASDTGYGNNVGSTGPAVASGRRPSGMVPNNVTARYMRNASQTEEERRASETEGEPRRGSRRPSAKSRQGSADSKIQPVYLPPDQHQHWQNSVARSMNRFPFTKPGETLERHRMQSLAGIADIAEAHEESPSATDDAVRAKSLAIAPSAPEVRVSPPTSPPRVKKQFSIDTFKANSAMGKLDSAGRVDTAMLLDDQMSPMGTSFVVATNVDFGRGPFGDHQGEGKGEEGTPSRPETPLESLGFRGAVPT